MRIGGLQTLTLLDYPGLVACTVFTEGCNFRCPFCHNAGLVLPEKEIENESISQEYFFEFLKQRKNRLDGVCITGGEPLLQADLETFINSIKELGLKVKLDTNGSMPSRLEKLLKAKVIDYVAMDIKSSPEHYSEATGLSKPPIEEVKRSVQLLMNGDTEYEFRTTITDELHNEEVMEEIAKWLEGAKRYYLQRFVDSGNLIEEGMHEAGVEKTKRLLEIVKTRIPSAELRGGLTE